MDSDSQSELEKRLEGMTPANQLRELVFMIEDLRKDVAKISKFIAEEINKKKDI